MGGRALKLVYTRRYALDEYLEKQDYLTEILGETFPDVHVPRYFHNKDSFGDIDIICVWPEELKDIPEERGEFVRKYIEDTFNPGQIYHNGNSWSFNVEELQVDMVMCMPEHFNSFCHYFSFNDLGNFMGRLAHGLGLKYGQEGLMYDHYFKGINIGRVIVSKDYPRIFEFLDLDYKRWEEGFDDLEDVFAFILTSKYFNYDRFQFESLNRVNRERNLKRTSYMKFLEYIENHKDKKYEYEEDKTVYLKKADKFFPEFQYKLEVRRMEYEYTRKLYVKAKFNGGMLIDRYKIPKEDVNSYMFNYIGIFEDEEKYKTFIIETPIDEIWSDFETYFNVRKPQQ
jgi:hypothetical protein